MAINERLVHTASATAGAGGGNQEEGLILHLDANDVDSYDGDGSVWYDITNHEYKPATNVSEHFNTVTYTGNGASNPITGVGFQPDLVWVKRRTTSTANHYIVDTVRGNGTSTYKNLSSNTTDAEGTTTTSGITNSTIADGGFTMQGTGARTNASGSTYVAWCFKAGGTAVSNTDGTVASQVSANNDLGFSIVKYTGTTSADDVGHGLDVAPDLVIAKSLDSSDSNSNWIAYASPLSGQRGILNGTQSFAASTAHFRADPTSTVLRLSNNSSSNVNRSGDEHIAYCFASKRGVSKVGSYTGGSTGEIYTGFEPAFIMVKRTNASGDDWHILDNTRGGGSKTDDILKANTSDAEASASNREVTFTRNGFKWTNTTSNAVNTSGNNYIYLAFAKDTNAGSLTPSTDGTEIETDLIFDPTQVHYSSTNYALEQDNTIWKGNASKSGGTHEGEVYFNNYFKYGDTGKYYFEVKLLEGTHFGVAFTDPTKYNPRSATDTGNAQDDAYFYGLNNNNLINSNGTNVNVNSSFASISNGDTISVAIDVATRKIWFGEVSGGTITWYGSGNPSSGTNEASVLPSGWNIYQPLVADTAYSGSSARYAWWQLNRTASATTLPTGFSYMTGAIKNADLELHLDPTSYSGSGTTWTAAAGSNATVVASRYDQELGDSFDISTDGESTIQIASGHPLNGEFTLEFWFKFQSTPVAGNRFIYDLGETALQFFYYHSNGWRFYQASGAESGYYGSGTIEVGKWQHKVITLSSSGSFKAYIDGELIKSASWTRPTTSLGAFDFGTTDITADKPKCDIGQIRMYSSSLTQDQIRQNFNFTKNDYPNGHNGTISGATWNSGGYFDFDGGTNDIKLNTSNFFSTDFTLSMWWKFDSLSGYQMLFGMQGYGSSSYNGIGHYINGSTIHTWVQIGGSGSAIGQSSSILSTGTWHNIVLLREGSTWKHYLDGALVGTYANKTTAAMNSPESKIGEHFSNSGLNTDGKCSKVKLYNKALSPTEITEIYTEGE